MPSPFPGMNPFIETQEWSDFHTRFISAFSDALMSHIAPRYVARVERRVYLERYPEEGGGPRHIRPDVSIFDSNLGDYGLGANAAIATTVEPVTLTIPMPEEQREAFLYIKERESMEVVTVIEVLSPANKRPGSDGQREYLKKRMEVARSSTNLVELDFLRGGDRLPVSGNLPPGEYYAYVMKSHLHPRVQVYGWHLNHILPPLPIPLAREDPDVVVNLQEVFQTVYDRAGYDYTLDYAQPLEPALDAKAAEWVTSLVK
ncbi:MAG: DUF4058 family protein [Planctomycetota bacterium]|nr:DUF4058 family protein [Planctomycetota bacterium]